MAFLTEIFLSEIVKRPVLDPKGEDLGRVRDVIVVKGDPLPMVSALIIERKKVLYVLPWNNLNIFNKKIISTNTYLDSLASCDLNPDDLLIARDILDKQIVDANGAKVVRVNDIKLGGYNDNAALVAIDIGIRGIIRRLGVERSCEALLRLFNFTLPRNLINWNHLQPLRSKLDPIALKVPRQMIADLHPVDIAEIINQISPEEGTHLIKGLDVETAAEALIELKPEVQAGILTSMGVEKAADLIEEMPPDDAADILSDLSVEHAQEILEHVEKDEAEDIQELLSHDEDTAGGLMTNAFLAYSHEITVADTIERLRQDAKDVESVYYIYVLDWKGKLMGVTSLREIILAEPDCHLADIIKTNVKTIHPSAGEMEAAEMVSKYNLHALPVVDDEGFIRGIITADDILDILLPARRGRG
jgi:CBS domain-containing protein